VTQSEFGLTAVQHMTVRPGCDAVVNETINVKQDSFHSSCLVDLQYHFGLQFLARCSATSQVGLPISFPRVSSMEHKRSCYYESKHHG